jgi:hypothetical protein
MAVLTLLLPFLLVNSTSAQAGGAQPIDLDGDGLADLVLVDPAGAPRFLRQAANGRFEELVDRAGLPERVAALHWRDIDGDGDLDVLATPQLGSVEGPRLFEQAGPLVFLEFPGAFAGAELDPVGVPEWIDLDGDGRIDLVWTSAEHVVVLRQVRRGAFEPSARFAASGASSSSTALAAGPGVISSATSVAGLSALASPSLICAGTLVDVASGNCIEASSQPTLGKLFPLSTDFNVGAAGRVGLGTTAPLERLDVAGRVRAQLGVRFGDGSLQTTAGTRDWNALLNMPAGFADGVDNDTTYTAGQGLSLTGEQFAIPSSGIVASLLAAGAVTSSKLAGSAVGAAALASDAASLARVTGGGASMAAGSLLVNTATPAGRVRVRHASSTASPHLMLTQDGTSTFSRIGMDNPLSSDTWILAGSLTATAADDRFNVFHSGAGDVLSVGGNGRVGVRTSNPLAELHVQGALHLDGATRDLSFPTGTAFQLGHYDGASFSSRLTVSSAGVVTATQDAAVGRDLDVNRDLEVTRDLDVGADLSVGSGVLLRSTGAATISGTLTVQNVTVQGTLQIPAGTRRRTLAAPSFQPAGGFLMLSSGAGTALSNQLAAPGSPCRAYAGIELPHGAFVTRLSASVNDSQPSANVSINLLRKAFDSTPSNDVPQSLALATSNSSAGDQLPTDTSISFATIDTVNFSYYIEIASTAPNVGELGIAVYAVQVEYTTADPLE